MHSEGLQHIANNLPDSFTDYKGVIQSYNPEKHAGKSGVPTKTTLNSPFKATWGEVRQ